MATFDHLSAAGAAFLLVGLAAWIGLRLAAEAGTQVISPANAALLSLLLLADLRRWGTLFGAGILAWFAAARLTGMSGADTFLYTLCNAAEVLIAAVGLRAYLGRRLDLTESRSLREFMLWAALLAPAASAGVAAMALRITVGADPAAVFATRFLADATGMALLVPPVLLLRTASAAPLHERIYERSAVLRAAATFALLAAVCGAVFWQSRLPLLFLVFPPLIFVAFRLGCSGAAFAVLLVGAIALACTVHGRGPLQAAGLDPPHQVALLQIFLGAACASSFPVAAAMTEKRRSEERLLLSEARFRDLSETDGLTGIGNRRRFDEALDLEWKLALRDGTPVSLLLIDVDWFKAYNDSYGHAEGDKRLQDVAAAIDDAVQRPIDLCVRFGGDEFAVILHDATLAGARVVAERIAGGVARMRIPHEHGRGGVLSLSIGLATVAPKIQSEPGDLFQAADRALYRAKHGGRNRIEADLPRAAIDWKQPRASA
ncbi:MAG: diguanylate cyclase [Nevskia sp.]|nr:diguanylate cyclase [Nevskia sp.]